MEEGHPDGEVEDYPGVRGGESRPDSSQDRAEGDISSVEGYPNNCQGDRHCGAFDDDYGHTVHLTEELSAWRFIREDNASQGAFRDQGGEVPRRSMYGSSILEEILHKDQGD